MSNSEVTSLFTFLKSRTLFDLASVVQVGIALIDILDARGETHGFLEPEVVLIRSDGAVALEAPALPSSTMDPLRIACLAPETLRNEPPTVASDIYGIGAMLACMSQGTPLGGVESEAEWDRRALGPVIGTWEPIVPMALQHALSKACMFDATDRLGSLGELQSALEEAADGLGLDAVTAASLEPTGKSPPRARFFVGQHYGFGSAGGWGITPSALSADEGWTVEERRLKKDD